jgi:hypothetical protein
MNINVDRFLALTALLAAPLVSASACIITSDDGDTGGGSDGSASASASTTNSTSNGTTDGSTTASSADGSTGSVDGSGSDSGGVDSGSGSDSTTGGDVGNCCEANGGPGCTIPEIQDCVCAQDALCCDELWDDICVGEVVSLGCGTCDLPPLNFDCYCTADCDGTAVDTPFEVCATDPGAAAPAGQSACEAALGAMCTTSSCEACECFTSELPMIVCE